MNGWRGHEQTEYNQKYRALSIKQVLQFKAVIKSDNIGYQICLPNDVLNFEIDENITPEQKLIKNTYEYQMALYNIIGKLFGHVFFTYMNFFTKLRLLLVPQISNDICYQWFVNSRFVRTRVKSDLLVFVFALGHTLYTISFVAMIYIQCQFQNLFNLNLLYSKLLPIGANVILISVYCSPVNTKIVTIPDLWKTEWRGYILPVVFFIIIKKSFIEIVIYPIVIFANDTFWNFVRTFWKLVNQIKNDVAMLCVKIFRIYQKIYRKIAHYIYVIFKESFDFFSIAIRMLFTLVKNLLSWSIKGLIIPFLYIDYAFAGIMIELNNKSKINALLNIQCSLLAIFLICLPLALGYIYGNISFVEEKRLETFVFWIGFSSSAILLVRNLKHLKN